MKQKYLKSTPMKNTVYRNSNLPKAIVAVFVLLSSGLLQAQSSDVWTLQSEKNGVKLYSTTENCGGKNMLFLKLENTNSLAKHVNYNIIIESPGHNMPLLPQAVELTAMETKMGSCDARKELTTDIKNITNLKLLVVMTVN